MPYIEMMQQSLFDADGGKEALAPGATLLHGFARKRDVALLAAIEQLAAKPVSVRVPDMQPALAALQAYIARRQQAESLAPATAAGQQP